MAPKAEPVRKSAYSRTLSDGKVSRTLADAKTKASRKSRKSKPDESKPDFIGKTPLEPSQPVKVVSSAPTPLTTATTQLAATASAKGAPTPTAAKAQPAAQPPAANALPTAEAKAQPKTQGSDPVRFSRYDSDGVLPPAAAKPQAGAPPPAAALPKASAPPTATKAQPGSSTPAAILAKAAAPKALTSPKPKAPTYAPKAAPKLAASPTAYKAPAGAISPINAQKATPAAAAWERALDWVMSPFRSAERPERLERPRDSTCSEMWNAHGYGPAHVPLTKEQVRALVSKAHATPKAPPAKAVPSGLTE